ncbi:MAG: hypothetical protein ACFFD2_13815 [Promethearchaeota archaeon]
MISKEKTILEEINEKIEDIILGRRYLITEMGKLKLGMDKITESLQNGDNLNSWIEEVKNAASSLGQLTGLINQLQNSSAQLNEITKAMEEIKTSFTGMTDLCEVSDQITLSTTKIAKVADSIIELRDLIHDTNELGEEFETVLVTMGELRIAMGGLKGTIETLTLSFEGLAGIADLNTAAKTIKPTIDDLRKTFCDLSELRSILEDLKRQTASLTDLKKLTSELKVIMLEIGNSIKGLPPDVAKSAMPVVTAPIATVVFPPPLASQVTRNTTDQVKKDTTVYNATRSSMSKTNPVTSPINTPTVKPLSPITSSGKKEKIPPIVTEVLGSLTERAQSGADAHELANSLKNARDIISKSWRSHPVLYELGTFARKLRKIPKGQSPSSDLLNILIQKIKEWTEKMVD